MKNSAEVVVIGSGIIGASIAYYLSEAGKEVVIVEKDFPTRGSSGACDGTLFLQSKMPGPKLEMAIKSAKLYKSLSTRMKYKLGYKQEGGMILIENEDEYKVISEIAGKQQEGGMPVSLISGDEARIKQPGLSDCVQYATWCPDDAHINPMYATLAFTNTAIDLGCEIVKHNPVVYIELENRTVKSVCTAKGKITAKYVVNAAGAWASEISSMVGIDTPVLPRKGEVVITEQIEPYLTGVYLDARYIAIKHNPKIAESTKDPSLKKGVGMVVEQTEDGNILMGSSREFVGFNRRTSSEVTEAIVKRCLHFFPNLRYTSMIHTFAGLRPYTPDGLPYLGPVNTVKGYVMAAGHEGDGIALAPETGRRIANYIINGDDSELTDYSPMRQFKK